MTDPKDEPPPDNGAFANRVDRQAKRRIKAKRNTEKGVWFGLGMMGLVGWSIVVPTILGAALGQWIDSETSDNHSWTLMLLIAGLTLGCWNAWRWVSKEHTAMQDDDDDD